MEGVQRDKKREEGKNNKKTCHLFDAVSVCHSLCSGAGKKKVKKRDLYKKISFDISKFKIKNNLRMP